MTRIDTKLLAEQLAHASREGWRISAERRPHGDHMGMLKRAQRLGRAAQEIAAGGQG